MTATIDVLKVRLTLSLITAARTFEIRSGKKPGEDSRSSP